MATDLSTLQAYRDEAVVARHKIATGERVVEIWRDGRRLTFSATDIARLTAYIETLDREIATATAEAAGRPRRGSISPGYLG